MTHRNRSYHWPCVATFFFAVRHVHHTIQPIIMLAPPMITQLHAVISFAIKISESSQRKIFSVASKSCIVKLAENSRTGSLSRVKGGEPACLVTRVCGCGIHASGISCDRPKPNHLAQMLLPLLRRPWTRHGSCHDSSKEGSNTIW